MNLESENAFVQGELLADNVSIVNVEDFGVEPNLNEIGEDLNKQLGMPQPAKRVMVPRVDGGDIPLGISIERDRLARTVCKMTLEPIYGAEFEDSSYGFRPDRSSKDAIAAIRHNPFEVLSAKYGWTDPAKICFSVHSLRNVKDEVSD